MDDEGESLYEEVEIEDMDYNEEKQMYFYQCPCGDKFQITLADLWDGQNIAPCPSCTLRIRVIYSDEDLPEMIDSDSDESDSDSDDTDSDN